MIAAVWYFMSLVSLTQGGAQFMGPYPSYAVCVAAQKGAVEAGGPVTPCMRPEYLDYYMYRQWEFDKIMDMRGEGDT